MAATSAGLPFGAPIPRLTAPGVLVLEDGSIYAGTLFGAGLETAAEVVFNTGMTGYQEICTDPSYRGQMVVLTHPQVGNYGVDLAVAESTRPWLAGLIVRELAARPHHWRATERLDGYLARHGVTGLEGVDTRALTRRLRQHGALRGVLASLPMAGLPYSYIDTLVARARAVPSLSQQDVLGEVLGAAGAAVAGAGPGPRVVVLDCGAKHNIVRSLARRGADIRVIDAAAGHEAVLAARPAGVVLANGPGDPAARPDVVAAVRGLLDADLPIMGICLGHQLLALAAGATTSRLPFGHHGSNHPVQDLRTGAVHITSQNHEFQVDRDSIPARSDFEISHLNLNDGSVEGLTHRERPIFSIQFHPEGCPGPQDNQYLFDRFFEVMSEER